MQVNQLWSDTTAWHPLTLSELAQSSPLRRKLLRLFTTTPLKLLGSITEIGHSMQVSAGGCSQPPSPSSLERLQANKSMRVTRALSFMWPGKLTCPALSRTVQSLTHSALLLRQRWCVGGSKQLIAPNQIKANTESAEPL